MSELLKYEYRLFILFLQIKGRKCKEYDESGGQKFEEIFGKYSFYIVGVYEYEEDANSFFSDSDSDVTTSAYLPITTGKEKMHTDDGYEKFTVVTNSSVATPP